MYDFLGDIHGHCTELEQLLSKLGYKQKAGTWQHPSRKVIFVGDYIDRGPQIRETLAIVRSMTESGNAIALMGNHEYNALCFHQQESEGGHLRKHLIKNIIQHYETLKQFQNRQEEYEDYLDWFMTLPLYYETPAFRTVHACWDEEQIGFLRQTLLNDRLTKDLLAASVQKESPLYTAIDITLKGKELRLPGEISFNDKDGTTRRKIRYKWWEDPAAATYRSISVEPMEHLPELVPDTNAFRGAHYNEGEKPVFFGHYWLKGTPALFRNNVCCLDYSVAKKGHLVAYRFDGERELDAGKLVYV